MKVLVGAEDTGCLKVASFKLSRDGFQLEKAPEIVSFGAEGRSSYIQRMIVIHLQEKDYIVVARRGGVIQMYDASTYRLLKEWKGASKSSTDAIVGLEFAEDKLYSCSAAGQIFVRDLSKDDDEANYCVMYTDSPVSCFRVHPVQTEIAASGGKRKDLEVVQIFPGIIESAVRTRHGVPVARPQRPCKMWKAKNARMDEMGFKSPIWVSDIRFLDLDRHTGDGWRIIASTRFGEVRIYETAMSRRPIINVEVSEHPLVNLWVGPNEHEVIYTDTQNTAGKFDTVTGRPGVKFQCAAGSLLSMHAFCQGETAVEEAGNGETGTQNEAIQQTISQMLAVGEERNSSFLDRLLGTDSSGTIDSSMEGSRETTPRFGSQATSIDEDEVEELEFEEEEDDDDEDEEYEGEQSSTDSENLIHLSRSRQEAQAFQSLGGSTQPQLLSNPPNINQSSDSSQQSRSSQSSNDHVLSTLRHYPSVIATGGLDKFLRVYNLKTGRLDAKINVESKISQVWILDPSETIEEEPIPESSSSIARRPLEELGSEDVPSSKRPRLI